MRAPPYPHLGDPQFKGGPAQIDHSGRLNLAGTAADREYRYENIRRIVRFYRNFDERPRSGKRLDISVEHSFPFDGNERRRFTKRLGD